MKILLIPGTELWNQQILGSIIGNLGGFELRGLLYLIVLLVSITSSATTVDAPKRRLYFLVFAQQYLREQSLESEFKNTPLAPYARSYYSDYLKLKIDKEVSAHDFEDQMLKSRVILISDHHNVNEMQIKTAEIIEYRGQASLRPQVVVLEWIPIEYQELVNKYLLGKMNLPTLKKLIRFDSHWGFNWKSHSKILLAAKNTNSEILLVETTTKQKNINQRDDRITKSIADFKAKNPEKDLIIPYGAYHLMGGHLEAKLKQLGVTIDLHLLYKLPTHLIKVEHLKKDITNKFFKLQNNIYAWQLIEPYKFGTTAIQQSADRTLDREETVDELLEIKYSPASKISSYFCAQIFN